MKYLPTQWSDARGATGGNVFSHNRGGLYVKSRAKPSQPRTAPQLRVRGAMSALQPMWSNVLTQAQRNGWTLYGQTNPVTDKLGQTIILSGINMFLRVNSPIYAFKGPTFVQLTSPGAVPFMSGFEMPGAGVKVYQASNGASSYVGFQFPVSLTGSAIAYFFITRALAAGVTTAHAAAQFCIAMAYTNPTGGGNYSLNFTDPFKVNRITGAPYRVRAFYTFGANISTFTFYTDVVSA